MSKNAQPAILADRPPVGRTLLFRIAPQSDVPAALQRLRKGLSPDCGVAGVGEPLVLALQKSIDGLRTFPAMSGDVRRGVQRSIDAGGALLRDAPREGRERRSGTSAPGAWAAGGRLGGPQFPLG